MAMVKFIITHPLIIIQIQLSMLHNGLHRVPSTKAIHKKNKIDMWDELDQQKLDNVDKISLVNKCISEIGFKKTIHNTWQWNRVKTLYLSNNFISQIKNIVQFPNLQHLSLSNNSIISIINIRYLSNLTKLIHLSMQNNPITQHIMYQNDVIANIPSLKLFDQKTLSDAIKNQAHAQWDIYHKSMTQLQQNYFDLMHLFELFKRLAVHVNIHNAFHFANIQASQTIFTSNSNLKYQIQWCLQRSREDYKCFPSQFIISLEESLHADVAKIIANGQSHINSSGIRSKCPVHNFIASMTYLAEKQQIKMQEIRQKILNKYNNALSQSHVLSESQNQFLLDQFHTTTQQRCSQQLMEIGSMMKYVWQGKRKQILFSEWKLVAKCLKGLKNYSMLRRIKKNSAKNIFTILRRHIYKLHRLAFKNCIEMNQITKLSSMLKILDGKQKDIMNSSFTNIKMAAQKDLLRQKMLENKLLIKNIWRQWKLKVRNNKMIKQNILLRKQVEEQNQRQLRYVNKIKLLQKLLHLTQEKLQAYQGYKQTQNLPQLLLTSFQQQIQNKHIKNHSLSSNTSIRDSLKSPSPQKSIRRNIGGKENKGANFFHQRKFNSSKKILRI